MGIIATMVLQRLAMGVVTLLAVSLIIFFAVYLLPGDLAEQMLGQNALPETLQAWRVEKGLDRPPLERYFSWLGGILQGDFGRALSNDRDIWELISQRLYNTGFLAVYAAAMSVPIAILLGLLAALFRNTFFDRLTNVGALTAISFPEYLWGYLLMFWLAQSGYFPSLAKITPDMSLPETLYRTFLPALTLTLVVLAHMMRMTRAAIVNLLASPYIEMARLKGVSAWSVIVRHALPNALAPIINVIALNLAYLITGVVVVEWVFDYEGLGRLMVDQVSKRDIPVVQAIAMIFAGAYILLNLLADVLSTLSNPRIIHQR